MEKLTARQEIVLRELKKFMAKNGFPPTVRELCDLTKLNSTATIQVHLAKLQEKGYIKKSKDKNRTIELLVPNEYLKTKDKNIYEIPLINNPKDNPLYQLVDPNEVLDTTGYFLSKKYKTFALLIDDDSMTNVGINKKDIVFVEEASNIKNGQLVAILTDKDEAIVRRYYKERKYIRLDAENEDYNSFLLDDVTILGKVIGLYRKF